jgi:hypothetical protein
MVRRWRWCRCALTVHHLAPERQTEGGGLVRQFELDADNDLFTACVVPEEERFEAPFVEPTSQARQVGSKVLRIPPYPRALTLWQWLPAHRANCSARSGIVV